MIAECVVGFAWQFDGRSAEGCKCRFNERDLRIDKPGTWYVNRKDFSDKSKSSMICQKYCNTLFDEENSRNEKVKKADILQGMPYVFETNVFIAL